MRRHWEQAPNAPVTLTVASDAHRGQVFAACFQLLPPANGTSLADRLICLEPQTHEGESRTVLRQEWLDECGEHDFASGPALRLVAPPANALSESLREPTAAAVAHLGQAALERGESVDPFQLLPCYGRLSAAEEKRQAREA